MTDIAEKILTAITAKEFKALVAKDSAGNTEWTDTRSGAIGEHIIRTAAARPVARVRRSDAVAWDGHTFDPDGVAAFIADNDPDEVLRSCAADREIVKLHTPVDQPPFTCATLLALARGYGIQP